MIISFLVFVFALFLVLGAYLLATYSTDQKRSKLQKRLSEALLHSAHTEDVDVVLARNELMSEIPWVNRKIGRASCRERVFRAEATCCRIARSERRMPVIWIIVSSRASASRGVFAWIVVKLPS